MKDELKGARVEMERDIESIAVVQVRDENGLDQSGCKKVESTVGGH